MKQYLEILDEIMNNGVDKSNRTGVDTRSVFGIQKKFDLRAGFPAVTTKKLAWKAVVSELLWFIEGSGDERRLAEIHHGSRDGGNTIWTANANAPYWVDKAKFPGDCGRPYGVQWRDWRKPDGGSVDQIANIVADIKNDPNSRRLILTAWNPGEISNMALPPCHLMAQFMVVEGKLSCLVFIRSNDVPLGAPFNIASYALLTHMLAHVTNLGVGELVYTVGDAHIYNNQIDTVREQLTRIPLPLPTLWLNPEIVSIDQFSMDDIKLENYQSHSSLKYVMTV